jgi:hypothetical protein
MKISILDDYHDTLRTLDCFTKLVTDHLSPLRTAVEKELDRPQP